jgi:hypothetical protein
MARVFRAGRCFGCDIVFWFNPGLVPAIVYDGYVQPICYRCVAAANPHRVANGVVPILVAPGAYHPWSLP